MPETWKLVPIEPTAEMLEVAMKRGAAGDYNEGIWAAMLAAAPEPPNNAQMLRAIAALNAARAEIERLRAALRLYVDAGFGNSTGHAKQGAAYDAAVEALGPNVRGNAGTTARTEGSEP